MGESTITYVVKYGDYLAKIGADHGTTWQEIWNHPDNADHRQKRRSPDVLYPGDVLRIPQAVTHPLGPPPGSVPNTPPGTPPRDRPAPWPYDPPPPTPVKRGPTWECPDGSCACHALDREPTEYGIRLFDHLGARMPNARCRVLVGGREVNTEQPHADATAELKFEVPRSLRSFRVEWAPEGMPLDGPYPYRVDAYVDLGESLREGVRRRLQNLGFRQGARVMDGLHSFATLLSAAGHAAASPEEAVEALRSFHDDGAVSLLLPEGASASPPSPTRAELTSIFHQFAANQPVTSSLTVDSSPGGQAGPAFALWPDDEWLSQSSSGFLPARASTMTVAPFGINSVRVRVRTRRHGPLAGATVLLTGPLADIRTTTQDGEATFPPLLPGIWRVTVFHHHHGPDPGDGDRVETGPVTVTIQSIVTLLPPPPPQNSPAVSVEHVIGFPGEIVIDVTLMDAGINVGGVTAKAARALTEAEVRAELLTHVFKGDVRLRAPGTFESKHDPTSGPLDDCTANCEVVGPAVSQRVTFAAPRRAPPRIADVAMIFLDRPTPAAPAAPDGSHFAFDRLTTAARNSLHLHPLNTTVTQRLVVGLARLCKHAKAKNLNVVYHNGMLTTNGDAHQDGRAIDIRGFGTDLPPVFGTRFSARAMVDFLVLLHWGRIPSWNPATTAADPLTKDDLDNVPSTWRRLDVPDHTTDFRPPPNGTNPTPGRLRFRLLNLPTDVPQEHMKAARALFLDFFDFFAREFTDKNTALPAPSDRDPPAIDIHDAENVIHPDHANPRLRRTHDDHFHVQFGPTR